MLKREILIIGHPTNLHPVSTKVMGFDIANILSEYREAKYVQLSLNEVKLLKNKILIITGLLTKPNGNNLTPEILRKLKLQNNIIINNSIDDYCFASDDELNKELLAYKEIDGVIFTNNFTKDFILKHVNIKGTTIPHHYDKMLDYINMDKLGGFKALYAGTPNRHLNGFSWLHTNNHILSMIEDLVKYPCHIGYREKNTREFFFKPGTKMASAAGSNSLIIISKDQSNIDLIKDYPLYVDSISEIEEKYEMCKSWYGTKKGNEILRLLQDVKQKTNIKTICNQYLKFINELE